MYQPFFDECEFIYFFSRVLGEDVFSPHEMRLSRAEAKYLQTQYAHLRLVPLSTLDDLGKAWFEICPEGVAV